MIDRLPEKQVVGVFCVSPSPPKEENLPQTLGPFWREGRAL